MSVALSAVIRTAERRSPAALVTSLTQAVERLPEQVGPWHRLTVQHNPSAHDNDRGARRDLARRAFSGPELRASLPRFDSPDVRIAASTGLLCWRFPGEVEGEQLPVAVRVAAWGPGFSLWGDEQGYGSAEVVFDPVWPFRTPGGTVSPQESARVADNCDLLVRLVEAVVETVGPESVRLHTDVGPPFPFEAHLVYYRDAAAAIADLRWIEGFWLQGEPLRHAPALRDVPQDQLRGALHEWRPLSTLEDVRAGLGRAMAVLGSVGPSQVEDVLVVGSCPARRLGQGFLVLSGEAFVDGFVDPFFAELADLAEPGE